MNINLCLSDFAKGSKVTADGAMRLLSNGRVLSWFAKEWLNEHEPGRLRVLTWRGISFCRQRELGTQRPERPIRETYAFLRGVGYVWIVDATFVPDVEITKMDCEKVIDLIGELGRPRVSVEEFDRFMMRESV